MILDKRVDAVREAAAALGPWFHNIDLGGVMTAPDHFLGDYPAVKWRRFADAIPADLSGNRACRTFGDVGQDDAKSVRRQLARRRDSDAARSARHDGNLVFSRPVHALSSDGAT